VLEAMACGTPVLVSRSSSLPEIVGDCGIVVDPYSVDSIAEGITVLCRESDRMAELAARARERASTFTWERCATTVLVALEQAYAGQ